MLKTCAYKIGNRLILKLSLFSKKVIIKKGEYSRKEKRRISKQSEAKLANPPPTGNCDCASVEGGIIGIVYSVENAIVFFKKKKGQWVAYVYVPHHYIVPVLFIFFSFDQGNRKSIIQRKLSLRFPLGHLIRA